jgi:hypothetical protein
LIWIKQVSLSIPGLRVDARLPLADIRRPFALDVSQHGGDLALRYLRLIVGIDARLGIMAPEGKHQPEGVTRAYLLVIDRAPQAVHTALRAALNENSGEWDPVGGMRLRSGARRRSPIQAAAFQIDRADDHGPARVEGQILEAPSGIEAARPIVERAFNRRHAFRAQCINPGILRTHGHPCT